MNKKELRLIEEINDSKPVVYIGDVIVRSLLYLLGGTALVFTGWLFAICVYHFMVALGLY